MRTDIASSDAYWTREAKSILRAELERRTVSYARLVRLLKAQGVEETTRSIANKVSRGSFSFVFFLQVMRALGAHQVNVAPTQQLGDILLPETSGALHADMHPQSDTDA